MDCDYCRQEFQEDEIPVRTIDGLLHRHCYALSCEDG